MENSQSNTYLSRMVRAAKLDVTLYEEVKRDRNAFAQAMGVVILSSLCAGVSGIAKEEGALALILLSTVGALVGWYLWALLTYFIGTRFLPEPQTRSDYGQLLRTIGFSSAPGILRIFGLIPGLTMVVFFLSFIWMLVAMVIAVRVALDYTSTLRALGVCAAGWLVQAILLMLLLALSGGLPMIPT